MATQEAAIDSRSEAVPSTETFDTIVIGGGQAGLAVGYYLKKQGRPFVILDANERIGGSWRTRTWSALATRARTSGWKCRQPTEPGSPGETRVRFHSVSSTRSGAWSCRCSGSSPVMF